MVLVSQRIAMNRCNIHYKLLYSRVEIVYMMGIVEYFYLKVELGTSKAPGGKCYRAMPPIIFSLSNAVVVFMAVKSKNKMKNRHMKVC